MRERRRKVIEKKVFSKTDLKNIWAIFASQDKVGLVSGLAMTVTCADLSQYKSENGEFLKDGDIIDVKKATSVDFEYRNYKANKRADLTLRHGDGRYGNEITVEGDGQDWVAGTFSKIETVLAATKPQHHWFLSFSPTLTFLATVVFGILILNGISVMSNGSLLQFNEIKGIRLYLALPFVIFICGIMPAGLLVSWVESLWPSIEFDFGPEHLKTEKSRKNRLRVFFGFIGALSLTLLPQLIGWLIEVLKKLLE